MIHEWPSQRTLPPPIPPAPQPFRARHRDIARIVTASVLSLGALGVMAWVGAGQGDRQSSGAEERGLTHPTPTVSVQTTDVVAPVTEPELRAASGPPAAAPVAAPRRSAALPSATARRAAPPKSRADSQPTSMPRRVARFITGDGRHEVRPFPTVPER
jgi:hypothetical protein